MLRGEEGTGTKRAELGVCLMVKDGQQRLLSDADGPWPSDKGEVAWAAGVVRCGRRWEVCCEASRWQPSSEGGPAHA